MGRRFLIAAAGSVLLSNGLSATAASGLDTVTSAAPYRVKDLQVLSGPSPFAAGCPGALGDGDRIAGAEIEPAITVNPANPRNIIGTWQQDLGVAARSDLVASSLDGGRTWTRATIPSLTRCTGGAADAASDPWVSAGGDGAVYFVGAPGFLSADPPSVGFVASRSRDGGRSWTAPTTVASFDPRNDKETITASPTLAGHAYVVWANRDTGFNFPMTSLLEFSRTTDSGATWSAAVVIDQPGPTAADISSEVLALPDGTLLTIFSRVDVDLADFSVRGEIYAARSRDEGRTWSPAVQVASQPIQPIFDAETGEQLPNQDLIIHSAAVAPDGSVDIAWDHDSSGTTGQIDVARSRDAGRTWTVTALPRVRAFAFEPSIAVDAHGTVGLTWYDFRNDRPGDAALTTDVWFAHSDDGSTWIQAHVAGPFDFRSAPFGRLGEYQGLAGLRGRGFAAIFTMAAPLAKNGPTDIFFARIGPG
jgi:hypothetical protein